MHHNHNLNLARLWIALLAVSTTVVHCKTASQDVSALNVMYTSLNSPSKLSGWKSSGGVPCGDSWEGIKCSGSSVTEINLSDMGLSGSMYSDLSNNNQKGDIPYRLPPNARYINLAHNQLKNQLGDMFGKLSNLKQLDVSLNSLSGNLPQNLKSLKNLNKLHLQNNISLVQNVENNKFTGWVPKELKDINSLQTGGNSWSSGPAPPPPPGTPPIKHSEKKNDKSVISGVAIAGIAFGVLAVIIIVVALSKRSSKPASHFIDEERRSQHRSFTTLASEELSKDSDQRRILGRLKTENKKYREKQNAKDLQWTVLPMPNVTRSLFQFLPVFVILVTGFKSMDSTSIDVKASQNSPSIGVRSSVSDCVQSFNDNEFANRLNSRRSSSIRVTTFTQAELQSATANFASGRLLGEGSIGCVYRAKYADGKYKIVMDTLVYVYDFRKPLTWNTRVRIALGAARAVEYLQEICSPPLLHKNIKSSNIMLDTDLNPRLSDYVNIGLSYLLARTVCFIVFISPQILIASLAASFSLFPSPVVRTSQNLGAGYNAPECAKPSAYTQKSDVYSFGVVMLSKPKAAQCLVRWATPQLHDINAVEKMADPALRGFTLLSHSSDLLISSSSSEPEFRPPVSELVQALVRLIQRSSI
uniref:Protein kinase domain-containing protein n=1 Tax=Glycine max TaxID=3847 RepID=K7KYS4_SOYBN